MSCHSEVCPTVATFDTAYIIPINFRHERLKRLLMTYDASEWHILHNMACNGPVRLVVGNASYYGQEYQV